MFDINDEECPVLVCERCGYVIRAFVYQEDDVYTCDFCDTIMTKTRFSLTNDETALTLGMTRESIDFLGAKVYWCARDLVGFPVGNHHFLAFIPDNPNDFTGKTVDMGGGSQGWTNGGQPKAGKLVSTPNDGNDLQSVRELRDPQNYPPGTFSDWDGEMHEIPTPQGMTDTQFINALQKAIDEYQNNCPYSLVDENCSAWVNSMLERVGIPKSERDRLGEFFGVDWGEEDLIPSQYFVKE